MSRLTAEQARNFEWDWKGWWARPNQLPPPGRWDVWLLLAGRGFGKALALDTPIPTPSGWTTMGSIVDGDVVFDESGVQRHVVKAHDVMHGRPCFAVQFSDGSQIIADAEHLWLTADRRTRKALRRRRANPTRQDRPQCKAKFSPIVRTTAVIKESLYDNGEANHSVECAMPLQCATADLPIDPYLLGCWLGDGHSAGGLVTTADKEIISAFSRAGFHVKTCVHGNTGAAETYSISGLRVQLRALGVLGNKHVPSLYLRASENQRRELLAGLMDTDGCCAPGGHVEFCNTKERLAFDVFELCCSLGFKPAIAESRARLYGEDCGPRWRVTWTPHAKVFKLARKSRRQHAGKRQAKRSKRRYIVGVTECDSVPVRCITVDGPSRLYLAGRAMIPTHNTATLSQWVRAQVEAKEASLIALVAPTAADARQVLVEGPAGILAVSPPWNRPIYEPSKRELTWPNGAMAITYSADEPERLRGPQHDAAICDELSTWRYPAKAWDNLMFGLRQGRNPRCVVATTPKPGKLLKDLLSRQGNGVVVTRGTTYENRANLATSFLSTIVRKYEGTRLGRQELLGELLEDVQGALWRRSRIDELRVFGIPALQRIVIAIDPAVSSETDSDETGIIVAGMASKEEAYILEDLSGRYQPLEWARKAISAYRKYKADKIIAEVNNGGEMVEATLRTVDPTIPYKAVHASRGKARRAEPIASLYELGQVHHVGNFPELEDQLCDMTVDFDPSVMQYSPDRLDAAVWALWELMLTEPVGGFFSRDLLRGERT